jgi:hypothetical protein
MVEFSSIGEVDLSDYRPVNLSNAFGTLGLITVNGDIFLVVVSGSSKVATVRPGETIQRIHAVAFCKMLAECSKCHKKQVANICM